MPRPTETTATRAWAAARKAGSLYALPWCGEVLALFQGVRSSNVRDMPSGNASGNTDSRALKVRENQLRRVAQRQGLALSKSPRRDPRALTYGTYMLTRPGQDEPVLADTSTGHLFGKTLSEVEAFLNGEGDVAT